MSGSLSECKITVLGDGGVGKTSLIREFVLPQGWGCVEYDPTIEDFYSKSEIVDGELVTMVVQDTSGQDELMLNSSHDQFIREADGYLVVYAINSRTSFDTAKNVLKRLLSPSNSAPPMVLVGNKCDLGNLRNVSTSEGKELADSCRCPHLETSAKPSTVNCLESFHQVIREIRKAQRAKEGSSTRLACCALL
eukprot:TRINITY_DN50688_c0_g3_i1.p1 TRINITY_DN50688_c0_g3~~TRINITY_DN50688_c0_g3_i1.p1  ORF type:complete len:193 (-),score=30.33 TRINITY_DN50688_c0_g3_i1:183-761(-)